MAKKRAQEEIQFQKLSSDYIPYACHYNENTILTKNGELLQTVKILGFSADKISKELLNLRSSIRNAIKNNINSNKYSVWLHTIRKKYNLDDPTPYPNTFSQNTHNKWSKKNFLEEKFVNELYLTVIHEGTSLNITEGKNFVTSLLPKNLLNKHSEDLDKAHNNLNQIVDKIIHDTEDFSTEKLALQFDESECYSDYLNFFSKIIHLNSKKRSLPINDLSESLSEYDFALGSNVIELTNKAEKKFAGILALKQYRDISEKAIDKFLQLPFELVISESIIFNEYKDASKAYKYNKKILETSRDNELFEASGLKSFYNLKDQTHDKYCDQQVTISIITEDIDKLEKDIARASNALSELGLVNVREDINLENAYWAQLPGNFKFCRRQVSSTTLDIGGLSSLHSTPTGFKNSIWGKAITILRTEKGTPFFFNYHSENSGHTCINGPLKSGKTVMMNFFLSEATKIKPKIFYLTNNNESEIFVNAIGGKWLNAWPKLNLIHDQLEEPQKYFANILQILTNIDDENLNEQQNKILAELSLKIAEAEIKNIQQIPDILNKHVNEENKNLIEYICNILKADKFKPLLNGKNHLDLEPDITAINFAELTNKFYIEHNKPAQQKELENFKKELALFANIRSILFYSILHQIVHTKFNQPTIICIDDFYKLMDHNCLADKIRYLMDIATKNNIIFVFSATSYDGNPNKNFKSWHKIHPKCDTQIYLPYEYLSKQHKYHLDLDDNEFMTLSGSKHLNKIFLIKQNNNSLLVELGLNAYSEILGILKSDSEIRKKYIEFKEHPNAIEQLQEWILNRYNEEF